MKEIKKRGDDKVKRWWEGGGMEETVERRWCDGRDGGVESREMGEKK